jgi:hypothetical protein
MFPLLESRLHNTGLPHCPTFWIFRYYEEGFLRYFDEGKGNIAIIIQIYKNDIV